MKGHNDQVASLLPDCNKFWDSGNGCVMCSISD